MSWYLLQTSPNCETKVIKEIERKIANGLPIREVYMPTETVFELKNSVKKECKKRIYANYIFLNMEYNDQIWHLLKRIPGVIGFVGQKGKPSTISEKEVAEIKTKFSEEMPKPKVIFKVGSKVYITSGTFANFYGIINSVDYSKNKAKVAINIFNRETEVEIELGNLRLE